MAVPAFPDARIKALRGRLIVSCQPVTEGPLDRTDFVTALARAVIAEGAAGVRIEGVERVAAAHRAVTAPIIGIVKIDLPATDIRITPRLSDIDALVDAGASIIAFDATDRPRPCSIPAMIARIHERGALALADVSDLAEGHAAATSGADLIASTLSGYVGPGQPPHEPDINLVRALAAAGLVAVAEGNVRLPAQAAALLRAGAHAVVVGSAITRPEHVTRWFLDAIAVPHTTT